MLITYGKLLENNAAIDYDKHVFLKDQQIDNDDDNYALSET